MSATEAWRTSLRELNRTKLCERKRRRGERDQAEERKRDRASEARACSLVAYRAARLRLKVRLQVQGRVEIAAGVAHAAPLDGVHAHRDTAVVVRAHRRRRVREPTLRLGALARAALELPAHLHGDTHQPCRARAHTHTRLTAPTALCLPRLMAQSLLFSSLLIPALLCSKRQLPFATIGLYGTLPNI